MNIRTKRIWVSIRLSIVIVVFRSSVRYSDHKEFSASIYWRSAWIFCSYSYNHSCSENIVIYSRSADNWTCSASCCQESVMDKVFAFCKWVIYFIGKFSKIFILSWIKIAPNKIIVIMIKTKTKVQNNNFINILFLQSVREQRRYI